VEDGRVWGYRVNYECDEWEYYCSACGLEELKMWEDIVRDLEKEGMK
jgi:hypothetical protein